MTRFVKKNVWRRTPHPHAKTRPNSLWWFPRFADVVVPAYVARLGTGRKHSDGRLEPDFQNTLLQQLHDLVELQQPSPRKKRYWTIPCYARARKLNDFTFCKRLRELEKIAKRLYPNSVPPQRIKTPLTEEVKEKIRQRFRELPDFRVAALAADFGIEPYRVGQLCRAEKAEIIAARDAIINSNYPPEESF